MSKAKDVIEIDETKHNVWFISDLLKRMTESEWVKEYLEFELIREIRKCKYYEWDNDACEEYCTKLKDANFDSKKACPICKYYSPKESDKRTYEQGKKDGIAEKNVDKSLEIMYGDIEKKAKIELLEKVLKNIEEIQQYNDTHQLRELVEELKQELKELSGEALSTGKSQKRGSKLKEVE